MKASTPEAPVSIGANGVNVSFSQMFGFTVGKKYLIAAKSLIPRVTLVQSAHNGTRAVPPLPNVANAIAAYSNYRNLPNRGSLIGDVVPYKLNGNKLTSGSYATVPKGPQGITAVPTYGFPYSGILGISNYATGDATQGYNVEAFHEMYLQILGDAVVSSVYGVTPTAITVTNASTGHTEEASYVYVLEIYEETAAGVALPVGTPVGQGSATNSSAYFRWQKYLLGSSPGSTWTGLFNASMETSYDFGTGISVKFNQYHFEVGDRWNFTAMKGHSFSWRQSGVQTWSSEVNITGDYQPLGASGVSLLFSQLSGYYTGDTFRLLNRTLFAYGLYRGLDDSVYTVRILGSAWISPVVLTRVTGSTTTGAAEVLTVGGTYTGTSTYTYEVKITSLTTTIIAAHYQWRKYLKGYAPPPTGGPYGAPFSDPIAASLSPALIDAGLYFSFGAILGHSPGNVWTFNAHKGDTFTWKKETLVDFESRNARK